jgi:hypothetical protein
MLTYSPVLSKTGISCFPAYFMVGLDRRPYRQKNEYCWPATSLAKRVIYFVFGKHAFLLLGSRIFGGDVEKG